MARSRDRGTPRPSAKRLPSWVQATPSPRVHRAARSKASRLASAGSEGVASAGEGNEGSGAAGVGEGSGADKDGAGEDGAVKERDEGEGGDAEGGGAGEEGAAEARKEGQGSGAGGGALAEVAGTARATGREARRSQEGASPARQARSRSMAPARRPALCFWARLTPRVRQATRFPWSQAARHPSVCSWEQAL